MTLSRDKMKTKKKMIKIIKRIFQINSKLENNQKGQKQPAIVGTVSLVDIVVLECWKNEKQKNNVKNGRETVTLQ